MAGERQTEPHQAELNELAQGYRSTVLEWKAIAEKAQAELARVRAERDEWRARALRAQADTIAHAARRALAAEACAENQAAEIVALIRSYANVHMTRALADLIEHKYIHGEESSA